MNKEKNGQAPTLSLQDVRAGYDIGEVLHGITLRVGRGERVCMLGRNGAGKTTTLRAIMGLLPQRAGRIEVNGNDVGKWPAHRIARSGVGYVPEERRIFPTLTVRENLTLALAARSQRNGPSLDDVFSLFPNLATLQRARGGNLSGGEQQMLTIARGLMTAPGLLLLDEPTEGLAPVVVADLQRALEQIVTTDVAVLLTEQKVDFALSLCDRAYVLDRGEIRFEGPAGELRNNERVLDEYLAVGAAQRG
ncbi:MAG: ATP-binding cassette domain-containing protein [Actinobacteria bacterium]|nr:ATP-binding cassette domain-containing protein [Actinomycetota bacterium]